MVCSHDPFWETFDDFIQDETDFKRKFVPTLEVHNQASADIKERIRVIQRLLELSYFEVRLWEVAISELTITIEMVIRIRYKEISGCEWKGNYSGLIDWFSKNEYADTSPLILHEFRKIRNYLVHPDKNGIIGPGAKYGILNILDIINKFCCC